MGYTLQSQLSDLHREILRMGQLVTEMIDRAVLSLARQDVELARQVIAADDEIDKLLIDIEVRSLQLMALQQPMARDLRAVGTGMKLVTDLERIADHATDIAEVTIKLEGQPLAKPLVDIPRMASLTQEMVREALDAYLKQDEAAARAMIEKDHEIDRLYRAIFDELVELMQKNPSIVMQATYLLHVALWLERIGDHATNLGEWTIYQRTGQLEDLNN